MDRRAWRRTLADWLTDSEAALRRAQARLHREKSLAAREPYRRAKGEAETAEWAALDELRNMQRV
jgi:hypothetical protein